MNAILHGIAGSHSNVDCWLNEVASAGRRDRRRTEVWMRAVARGRRLGEGRGAKSADWGLGKAIARGAGVADLVAPLKLAKSGAKSFVVLGAMALLSTMVSLPVAYGYFSTSDDLFKRTIQARRASAIFEADGRLLGAVFPNADRDSSANYAFLPLRGELPLRYAAALKEVEDRRFGQGQVCGIDWSGLVARVIRSGLSFGGSGLTQQLTKQLLAGNSAYSSPRYLPGPAGRIWSKLVEVGATCRLSQFYGTQGGANAIIRAYAEHAPVMQGNGVLRGVEAAAATLWGVKPQELSVARQALVAVSVKRPLMALGASDLAIPCNLVWPRNSPHFDESVARNAAPRQVLCRALTRARAVLPKIADGGDLEQALGELDVIERDGFDLQQRWARVPNSRLANLNSRTAALLPEIARAEIAREVDMAFTARGDRALGAPIDVLIDAEAQQKLNSISGLAALGTVQAELCLRLPGQKANPRRGCPSAESRDAMLLTVRSSSAGALRALFSSSGFGLDTTVQLGSIAKIAAALAAARSGVSEDVRVCPRATEDGGRQLSRASDALARGFSDQACRSRANLITIRSAFAKSDNLALLEALRVHIGRPALEASIAELGWSVPVGEDPLYSVAFGTILGSPRSILAAWTALASEAYGQQGYADPHVLASLDGQAVAAPRSAKRIRPLSDEARGILRALLEAPLSREGTLAFLGNTGVAAGKTGTTQSAIRTAGGERYVNGKIVVAYSPQRREAALVILSAPGTGTPLAPPRLRTSALAPILRVTL